MVNLHPCLDIHDFHYNLATRMGSIFHLYHRWILDQKNLRVKEFFEKEIFWKQILTRSTTMKDKAEDHHRSKLYRINKNWLSSDLQVWNLTDQSVLWRNGTTQLQHRGQRELAIHQQGRQACDQNQHRLTAEVTESTPCQTPRDFCHSRRPSHRYTCCYVRERLSTGTHQPSGDR